MLPHVKKMPPLAQFRGDKPAPVKPKSPDELWSIAKRWEAVGVGKVTRH